MVIEKILEKPASGHLYNLGQCWRKAQKDYAKYQAAKEDSVKAINLKKLTVDMLARTYATLLKSPKTDNLGEEEVMEKFLLESFERVVLAGLASIEYKQQRRKIFQEKLTGQLDLTDPQVGFHLDNIIEEEILIKKLREETFSARFPPEQKTMNETLKIALGRYKMLCENLGILNIQKGAPIEEAGGLSSIKKDLVTAQGETELAEERKRQAKELKEKKALQWEHL